jgi:hypothetical protein
MDVIGQLHTPAALPPGEEALGNNRIGGWVGPTVVLDAVGCRQILSACRELNPSYPAHGRYVYRLIYPG